VQKIFRLKSANHREKGMILKIFVVCGLLPIILSHICGCVPLLVGAGVATGYTLSNDAATGNVESEYRILWDLCMDKLEEMQVENLTVNESKGLLKAKISGNSVTIKINTINPKTQKLKVSARKYLLPKPQFAQRIFIKIVEELKW